MFPAAEGVCTTAGRAGLRLHLVEGIGPILAQRLLSRFGSFEALFAASRAELDGVRGIGAELTERIKSSDPAAADREIELASRHGVRIICMSDADYPAPLRAIPDPPVCLYVRGRIEPQDAVALGVVGSRRCTMYGQEQAERLAAAGAERGLTIVSGLALGIDSAAHRGALRGGGRTLAVLGCGLAQVYPPRNAEMAEQIAASGALLSEFPMQMHAAEENFPRRNRIIAGLSLGVLIIEASDRSGALITARLATDYNREVFALPGRVDGSHAQGCHRLIRDGQAKLITCIEDVLEELGEVGAMLSGPAETRIAGTPSVVDSTGTDAAARSATAPRTDQPPDSINSAPSVAPPLDDHERCLLDVLSTDATGLEDLIERSGLPPARVAAKLTSLQLKGLVRRQRGELYARSEPRP